MLESIVEKIKQTEEEILIGIIIIKLLDNY